MNNLERNIRESFRRVKNDIIDLQRKMTELAQEQERIIKLVADNRVRDSQLANEITRLKTVSIRENKQAVKIVSPRHKKTFIASKTGNKVHLDACPFAKNIAPKNRVVFRSKAAALNKGYKACECLKR